MLKALKRKVSRDTKCLAWHRDNWDESPGSEYHLERQRDFGPTGKQMAAALLTRPGAISLSLSAQSLVKYVQVYC